MTKTDLVNFIAEKTGLTKADAARALDAVQEGVISGLKEEGKVALTGFCTFNAVKKDAKEYRSELEAEVIKLAFIASPYIPSEIMADSIKGLDTEKLKSLRDAYKTETSSPWVQIKKQENKDNSNFVL